MIKIKHGFPGQKMIILPFYLVEKMGNNSTMNDLYIHSLGYFPNAKYHYIDRTTGCPENIFIFCSDGEGWFECDGKHYILKPNQFVILSANTPHRYGSSEKKPWSIYWIHFKGYKSSLFSERLNIPISTETNNSVLTNNNRVRLFEEIYNVLDNSFDDEALIYTNLSLAYFLGFSLYHNTSKPTKERRNYGSSVINLATHYMSENIDKKLKLEDIANHFGFSTSYFYRLFYKSMGQAPMEYFTFLKIQKACYLLVNTGKKINEISTRLGFTDPYYFSRIFSKTMGLSPAQYRTKYNSRT